VVIDTSALIAVVLKEQSESALRTAMDQAPKRQLSAVSLLEAGIVLRARLGESALPFLFGLLQEIGCPVVPFDEAQAKAAIAAFGRFGKGTGHRAQLNFGDCAVYALAALQGEPVLATGHDFRATDLASVPLRSR
jgi:ribonuclease VapC